MKSVTVFLAVLIALAFCTMAKAEVGSKGIGGALEIALPMGNFGDVAGTGFGVTANFQYGWKPNIDLMGQLGYIKWGGKTAVGYDYSYHAIPIQVGAKYYFKQETNRFYVGGLVGFHMFGWSADYDLLGIHYSGSSSETKFSLAPMGGYEMKIGENMLFDASARYQIISDVSYLGVRAGIIYKLK
ncbi:MAG TPA: hypothetical protein DEO84_02055 [candidate division Zixibacteria bacterium]|jgi:hypothetical protein|nr:hypothetical protein [candidate division Zixibacteria bacterium]HBZ00082.1 hypothetical protein [candidate division Zixibacteria bacterium]